MAIDRTAFNALVDDDGSNTVGTPIVKNTIKAVLLDPIDAALTANAAVVRPVPAGGTGVATLTGILKGNAAAAITAIAIPADATKYLDGTGAFTVPPGAGGWTGSTTGQIPFPATQAPSAGVNVLDDYEEGSWTPSLGGTATYSAQAGTYTKIGRLVFYAGHLTLTAIGSGSTGVISGLPFAASAVMAAIIGYFSAAAGSFVHVSCHVSGSTITVVGLTAAAANMSNPAVFFGSSTDVYFSGVYST